LILTVHSPELERQLFEARSRHRLAVEALVTYDKEVAPLQLKRQELLEIQLRLARQALGHQRSSLGDVNAGLARQRRLVGAGVESQNSLFQYEFLRDRSLQERAGVEREGSAAELQSASLAVERAAERLTLERNVKESEALLAALEHRDSSRQVLAPQGGRVESIVVQPGEHLEAGTPVATLLTSERLGPAIAFLPERDRAFVRSGDRVELELDQLPAREFGRLEARVVRVSSDLASVAELRDAFGESSGGDSTGVAGPMYRVELTLVQSERLSRLSARMRSGMLFNARFVLRNRRVISLVLDPIRNW
jgi:multidrug resistance efflux pump